MGQNKVKMQRGVSWKRSMGQNKMEMQRGCLIKEIYVTRRSCNVRRLSHRKNL